MYIISSSKIMITILLQWKAEIHLVSATFPISLQVPHVAKMKAKNINLKSLKNNKKNFYHCN